MFDYWVDAGVLWSQIVKAIHHSGKVLVIKKDGVSVNGGVTYLASHGEITIAQLEDILHDCV